MEPEPDSIDLAVLDPTRDGARFDATASRIAQRAVELRRLRRAVVRRGATAFAVAMAAALLLWFTAPRRAEPQRDGARSASPDILDWAMRDAKPDELLLLGGGHAE